ncbi:acyltransferase family protein [Pseudoroseomonas wenyumeiae]
MDEGFWLMLISAISLEEAMTSKENNFDAIRLAAALLVLFSHSYPLTGSGADPIATNLGGYDTGGGIAVSMFFVLSGFLVYRSAERHDAGVYLRSRVLRIVPGLAVCLILSAFVLGPVFTNLSATQYFLIWPSGAMYLGSLFSTSHTAFPGSSMRRRRALSTGACGPFRSKHLSIWSCR